MKRGPGESPVTPGWVFDKALPAAKGEISDGGYRWNPPGFVPKERTEAEKRAGLDEDEKRRKRNIGLARKAWSEAGNEAGGGGPNHPRIRAYVESRGVPISWLPGASLPRSLRFAPKCVERWDGKRWTTWPAMIGQITGAGGEFEAIHRIYLDGDGPGKRAAELGEAKMKLGASKGRAVRLSENMNSGVLVLCEGIETGLAILAGLRNRAAVWALCDAVSLQAVELPRDLVAFGKAEAIHTVVVAGDLDANDAGQKAAAIASNVLRRRHPWLTVVTRFPSSRFHPDLVEEVGGQERPRNGEKSADWLDVLRELGRDKVAEGILYDLELEANRQRAFEWNPDEHRKPDAIERGEAPADGDGDPGVRYIDDSPLLRARLYLVQRESPPPSRRAGSGFYVRRFKGRWYEYDLTRWVKLEDEHLRGRIWDWLDSFYTTKRGRTVRVDSTKRMVDDILAAATTDTAVAGDTLPTWVPPSFDANGRPRWGMAAPGARRGPSSKPEAGRLIAYQNGLLDIELLRKDREVKVYGHDPRWFSTSCLPYNLPFRELREALRGPDQAAAVLEKLCPTWIRFLASAWDLPASALCLQEWFGYAIIPDNSLERICLIQGPPGSGKGTIEHALCATIGEENVSPTSFDLLGGNRFHPASLVGKNVALMSDAHVGKFTDVTKAVEFLKSISGGDATLIEEKFSRDTPLMRLFCRFFIFCNEMPNLLDTSNALASRLCVIPMSKSFRESGDPTLKARVKSEVQGITVWALLGLLRLLDRVEERRQAVAKGDAAGARRDVFTAVEEAASLLEDYRRDSSPVYGFVKDYCVTAATAKAGDPPLEEDVQAVYQAWVAYAKQNNRHPGSPEALGRKLRAVAHGLRTGQHGSGSRSRYYVGLRLTPDGRKLMEWREGEPVSGPTLQEPAAAPVSKPPAWPEDGDRTVSGIPV